MSYTGGSTAISGTLFTVVNTYADMLAASPAPGTFWRVLVTTGSYWTLNMKKAGDYYTPDGISFNTVPHPNKADQTTIDAGTDDLDFITSKGLTNSEQLKRANSFAKIFTFMGS